jgi:hypothetical protein
VVAEPPPPYWQVVSAEHALLQQSVLQEPSEAMLCPVGTQDAHVPSYMSQAASPGEPVQSASAVHEHPVLT